MEFRTQGVRESRKKPTHLAWGMEKWRIAIDKYFALLPSAWLAS